MCFSPYLQIGCGVEGLPKEWYTICSCSFSPCADQNSEFSKLVFFIARSPQNDHLRYEKHTLRTISVLFTLFGYWVRREGGVSSQESGTQRANAAFHPIQPKGRSFRTFFLSSDHLK